MTAFLVRFLYLRNANIGPPIRDTIFSNGRPDIQRAMIASNLRNDNDKY